MKRTVLLHPLMIATLLLTAVIAVANDSTLSPVQRAERLLSVARQGGLDDDLAGEAADLLNDRDPFVRGLAEWALATKVNEENNVEVAVWPKSDPPAWFQCWMNLDEDFLLMADYVRQGAGWEIHHKPVGMLQSVDKIMQRATGVIDEIVRRDPSGADQVTVATQLEKLQHIRQQLVDHAARAEPDLVVMRQLWVEARLTARQIVLANPAVDFEKMVFVKRHPALFANITGSQYPWSHKPGGDICIQTGLTSNKDTRQIVNLQLGPGHVHGLDLHWDADRVVFGYSRQPKWPPPHDTVSGDFVFLLRGCQEPTHIYEIGLDGTGLQQLTDHEHWSDFEPTYCADDSVVFASDRSGRSSECGKFSADHTVINLYRRLREHDTILPLNDNKDIDRYPHSLNNGQIAYTRWEYQERHFMETHAVWSMRPDGTMADAVFNQHLRAPYGLRDTRSVPGSQRLVAIATGHHTLAYGPIVLIDGRQGINREESLQVITPRVVPQEGPMAGRPVASGGPPDCGGVYQTPWALSETCFLAAYSYSSSKTANGFSIYLVDAYGNKELVARDLIYSCSSPIPLKPRPRPPRLPDNLLVAKGSPARENSDPTAVCYVGDVYEGLEGIPRGTVKYLRISQRVGWPLDDEIGAMRYLPGNAWATQFGHWNWAPVRVIGEVPVEADGSAQFIVPAGISVYFQALDESHMEVRRMRSHVTFQPGEKRGCTGCHESRLRTPVPTWQSSLAWQQPPQVPQPPPWGSDRLLGFESLIQPILNEHCAGCHSSEDPDGGVDLSDTPTEDGFCRSFVTLFEDRKQADVKQEPLVSIVNRLSDASITKPKQFGSHRSRLIRLLREDNLHRTEVKLDDDQWLALVTWIDANAPYHDRFFNRRPADGSAPKREISPPLVSPFARR